MRTFALAGALLASLLTVTSCSSARYDAALRLTAAHGQYYGARNTPAQVRVHGDVLELGANRVGSGLVSSEVRTPSFTYGTVRVRARLSAGVGMWPAIWLVPDGPRQAGGPEIDVVELPQRNAAARHTAHFTYHWTDDAGVARAISTTRRFDADLTAGYHDYAVAWAQGSITWSVDGKQVMHVETSVARSTGDAYYYDKAGTQHAGRPATIPVYSGVMYLRVTNGVGSADSWPGAPSGQTVFPNAVRVQSIRVEPRGQVERVSGGGSFALRR